jgi:hypothetical protein
MEMKEKIDIKEMLDNQEPLIAQAIKEFSLFARLQKAKYDALVSEGFTDAQAIELCKKI